MATVNLGSIKFNWKGTYAGATAYKIDDVVEYNGSSYISIQAGTGNLPTDTAYWELMSQKGTNGTDGTDLTSTLTTQGDILYRDGSGLQRLGAGTSGYFLKTQGTGANPVWGEVQAGMTSGTAVTGSGSVIDFTGIPSTAKHIIIGLHQVKTTDNGEIGVQLGTSGGIQTTNYKGGGIYVYSTGVGGQLHTNGFFAFSGSLSHFWGGIIMVSNLDSNIWVSHSNLYLSDDTRFDSGGGSVSLGSTLDRVRIITNSGGGINSGTVNIKYI
jgi:hypothetical protein